MNPTGLKNKIRRHFTPMMQHDSHEFLMHIIGELQDEETPLDVKKFNGEVSQGDSRSIQQIYD